MEELLDSLVAKSTLEELGCDNMTAILIEFIK
jgi:serine/threonine protein phosphatase PrpC